MKKTISIVGGGSAALILAAFLDPDKFEVSLYERSKALGRKFLVAGSGGFNLTHSEPIDQLIERYTPSSFLEESLHEFDNTQLRAWLSSIGIPTIIGSSKRVYPEKGIKPVGVLNAIVELLNNNGVVINTEHSWEGWSEDGSLAFNSGLELRSDHTVFALGGASWKVTGSDGLWAKSFAERGIALKSFQASNCAYRIDWPESFLSKFEGSPLKNIVISCNGRSQKGEAVISKFGLEGNAIYGLSPQIRKAFDEQEKAIISLDLKPTMTKETVLKRFEDSTEANTTLILRNDLKLSKAQLGLIKHFVSKEDFTDHKILSSHIKGLALELSGVAELDEAISTSGGVCLTEVDPNFQLKAIPNHYCIGEMLDWDAPTGGYLLQACFSMGVKLARHLNQSN